MWQRWVPTVAFIGSLGAVLFFAWLYLPFVSDDALISFRYAERFAEGKGLTWTEGRPVEGYSNLLWVLLCSLAAMAGYDLVEAARVLGLLCVAAVLLVVTHRYSRSLERLSPFALCAVGFCACSGTLAVWSIGGLETPLVVALLAVGTGALMRAVEAPEIRAGDAWTTSIAFGLLCITRPDAPLFVVVGYATFLALRARAGLRVTSKDGLRLLSFPAALTLGQLAFRLVYYGEWVPNTALVKLAASPERVVAGVGHVLMGALALMPMTLVVAWSLRMQWVNRAGARIFLLPASLLAAWVAYLVFIGGDIFPAYRHFAPIVVLAAFVIAETDRHSVSRAEQRYGTIGSLVGCAFLLVSFIAVQVVHPEFHRAKLERWEWDGKVLATVLRTAFSEQQPLVAVTAAGCIPFWSKLPSLDMLGLNDYYLPRHPPPDFGKGFLAHELGSADYVLRRDPDLIVFHVGSEPRFRAGEELSKRSEFYDRYVEVRVVGYEPHQHEARVWFNQTSRKIGVVQDERRVVVPGYFFARSAGSVAELDAAGELVLRLEPMQTASFEVRGMESDAWRLEPIIDAPSSLRAALETTPAGVRVVLENPADVPVGVPRIELVKEDPTLGRSRPSPK